MLKHLDEHDRVCKRMDDSYIPKKKFPIEELKSFLEQSIKNDDESIDFLHNSRHKRDEDWYEKWSLNKVKANLGTVLYSPVCTKLCIEAGVSKEELDKLLSRVITEIVEDIW